MSYTSFGDQRNYILNEIGDRSNKAISYLYQTQNLIVDVRAAIIHQVSLLDTNAVRISTENVNTIYEPSSVVLAPYDEFPTAPTAPVISTESIIGTIPALPVVPTVPASPTLFAIPDLPSTPVLPAVPTIPTATAIAISDEDWNAAFLRAEGLQDRISTRRIWEASNLAAAMGHAQLSESQAILLQQAIDEDDQRTSDNALKSATEQAAALRQDTIALTAPNIDLYNAQAAQAQHQYELLASSSQERYKLQDILVNIFSAVTTTLQRSYETLSVQARENFRVQSELDLSEYQTVTDVLLKKYQSVADIQKDYYVQKWTVVLDAYKAQWDVKNASELARLEYEKLELQKVTDPERVRAEYELKKTEVSVQTANGQLIDLVQVYAQITNSLLSASNVSASSAVGSSTSPTPYTPDVGGGEEIFWE